MAGAGAVLFLASCSSSVASKVSGTYTGTVTNQMDPAQNVTITITEVTETAVDITIDPAGSFSDVSITNATVNELQNGNLSLSKSANGFSATYNADAGTLTGTYMDSGILPKQFTVTKQ